jgi:O-methyltransferase/methyltransferase family protein
MNSPLQSPRLAMLQILSGRWVSGAVTVAAQLGVADELAAGPRTAEDIATAVGAHGPSLRRLLRALASVGIFAEDGEHRFANTPLSETLETGPGSVRALAKMLGDRPIALAWADVFHSVTTGESAFEKVHGTTLFDYFARDPDFARTFSDAMTARSAGEAQAVHAVFDFSGVDTLVDVGGGHGMLLAGVLAKNHAQCGVLFDLPSVVAGAGPILDRAGVASRCEVVGGNFFERVPLGADGYLLKHILHDWDDETCVRILRNIHAAARPGSRLFVLEAVIEPGNAPQVGKLLDLQMLVVTHGGRERTRGEWESLLRAGGYGLSRVVETPAMVSVIEALRE